MDKNILKAGELIKKNRKRDVDALIEKLRSNGGTINLEGNFTIQMSYVDGSEHDAFNGFFVTIFPQKDGSGANIKIDPYDVETCSGVSDIFFENEK